VRELSLFSGAGGGLLGTRLLGWTTIGYVEWDKYCQQVIAARIRDGYLPAAPIFGDVREFVESGAAAEYRGFADVVTGGFPCQPFSVAGKRAGHADERNMWPATIAVIRCVRPRYAFLENVPGLLSSGYFGRILGDLAESGYDVRWRVLSAAELGAPHRRERLWIVAANANGDGRHSSKETRRSNRNLHGPNGQTEAAFAVREVCNDEFSEDGCNRDVPDADDSIGWGDRAERKANQRGALTAGHGFNGSLADTESARDGRLAEGYTGGQRRRQSGDGGGAADAPDAADADDTGLKEQWITKPIRPQYTAAECGGWWEVEPGMGRVVDGMAHRVDKLRALGNGQVPIVAATAWRLLTGE
jgi:DNA (cytosine-5)-methyltransferase 1